MEAELFVRAWLKAWNNHDLEAVLAHFHDEVVFSSPVAKQLLPASAGVLHGKEALRAYWTKGLAQIPDLKFTLEGYFVGIGALVIQYRNQRRIVVNEVLIFEEALVRRGYGTYPEFSANPAGLR